MLAVQVTLTAYEFCPPTGGQTTFSGSPTVWNLLAEMRETTSRIKRSFLNRLPTIFNHLSTEKISGSSRSLLRYEGLYFISSTIESPSP